MAAPNLAAVTSIFLKTLPGALTNSLAVLLTCPANKALEIVSIYLANVDSVAIAATLEVNRSGTHPTFLPAVTIQPNAALTPVLKDGPIVLEEGDELKGFASVTANIHYIISYREYDDA